jgi:multiphosphoryl transfer protein
VPYLPMLREENPALGLRGIRLGIARPDMLATQLRAIVAGVPHHQCRIMVPMIVDRDALRTVRRALDEACRAVGQPNRIPLGIMVETPSAALLIDSLAAEADFISVGTNDLSQYTLAADRGNAAVADIVDAFHPAVLQLIQITAQGATAAGKCVGVCGGLASDPAASALLLGLGVTELSVAPTAVPTIKARVATLKLDECRAIARRALQCATARDVHALLGDG